MPRSVGKRTTPGTALTSFIARHPRVVSIAFVVLVVGLTQGAAAEVAHPIVGPSSTGSTSAGP